MGKQTFKQLAAQLVDTSEQLNKKIIRHWMSGVHKPDLEINLQPSQTIPDASMSISQMLKRVSQGLPINGNALQPVYNGEKLLPNWKALDLIDRARIKELATKDVAEKKAKREKQEGKIQQKREEYQKLREAQALKQAAEEMVKKAADKSGA